MVSPVAHEIRPEKSLGDVAQDLYARMRALGYGIPTCRNSAHAALLAARLDRSHHHREAPADSDDFMGSPSSVSTQPEEHR